MNFEEACSEMNYILSHLGPTELVKIPTKVVSFFKDNVAENYTVTLDVRKNLDEQDMKEETKAFIKILFLKYLASESEKKDLSQQISKQEELESKEMYDNIFRSHPKETVLEENSRTELIEYEQNGILRFFKNILSNIRSFFYT